MGLFESKISGNINHMTNADAILVGEWDGHFVDHSVGLGKPIDVLPNVSSQEEQRLLQDAQFVYDALKLHDKQYTQALHSSDPKEQEAALNVQKSHGVFIKNLETKILNEQMFVKEHESTLNIVASEYKKADKEFQEGVIPKNKLLAMDERVRQRIENFDGVQMATDADLTMTTNADYLHMIPGSVQAENYMAHEKHGREKFPLVFSRYWREAIQRLASNFFTIGKNVEFRPGVQEFFEEAHKANIPRTIISANFRPLIDGILSRLPFKKDVRTFAVEENDISVTDKGTVLQKLVIENPQLALFYFGDGGSDLPAVQGKTGEVIACYFALKGGSFAEALKAANLPFYEYESYQDIVDTFRRLNLLPTYLPQPEVAEST
jgi:2-hydroxy-3-keto-5-methylthiopentenyl-1-phosphate phosphatase